MRFLLLSIFNLCFISFSLPIKHSSNDDKSKFMSFMINYGYIPQINLMSSELKHFNSYKNAIENVQKYAGIPITGVLDEKTLNLIKKKRCGNSDIDYSDSKKTNSLLRFKRYALNGAKWQSNDITWNVKSWPKQLSQANVIKTLEIAFSIWENVSKISFRRISNEQNADIQVDFLKGPHNDPYPFDGPGKVLAHAFFPGTGIGGDVHFDLDEKWATKITDESLNEVDLFPVASHEIGHSLGLSHSTVVGSLMFPYYQNFEENFNLPEDDVQAIQLLYGSKHNTRWTPVILPSQSSTTSIPKLPNIPKNKNQNESSLPKICETSFDTIVKIRGELFFFKDKYFWRKIDEKKLERTYPVEIRQFFKFPRNIERIDAAYERPLNKKIVFFVGDTYYEFIGNKVNSGFPKSIQNLGFPSYVKKIDAAFTWNYNGKTYFFSQDRYWRFDEKEERIETDYPREISVWSGLPSNLNSAFTWQGNGLTYFTKGKYFYKFLNRKMRTIEKPELISKYWFDQYCN